MFISELNTPKTNSSIQERWEAWHPLVFSCTMIELPAGSSRGAALVHWSPPVASMEQEVSPSEGIYPKRCTFSLLVNI